MKIDAVENGSLNNYTYAVETVEGAILIDPSLGTDKIMNILGNERVKRIKYIINTHSHFDHIVNNPFIEKSGCMVIANGLSDIRKDISINMDSTIRLIGIEVKFILTPGHSNDSMVILMNNNLFTGDTLFVEEIGRVDLPESSPEEMYRSLYKKIMVMPDETVIYPGHNYGPTPTSTLGREKKKNPWLSCNSEQEFIKKISE